MNQRRILFVDDDPSVLAALENLTMPFSSDWDAQFVTSAETALDRLEAEAFDVVVSDLLMPGTDGAELLRRAKEQFPRVARIAMTGPGERDALMRALSVVHQFVAKPCDAGELSSVIDRACELQSLLANEAVRRLVGRVDRVPSVPHTYWELTRALGQSEVDVGRIAEVVERDAAMSAKILQLVNSAYFGLAQRTTSIDRAVAYLGVQLIKGLALTAHVFAAFEGTANVEGFSLERSQQRALLTGRLSRKLLSDPTRGDDAFTAGLVHDIGEILIAMGDREGFTRTLRVARERGVPVHLVEKEILGVTHAEVGAYLLGLWGLPFPIVEAAAYHHTPGAFEPEPFGVLGAVHVADALIDEVQANAGQGGGRTLDQAYLEAVGVVDELPRWRSLAEDIAEAA